MNLDLTPKDFEIMFHIVAIGGLAGYCVLVFGSWYMVGRFWSWWRDDG